MYSTSFTEGEMHISGDGEERYGNTEGKDGWNTVSSKHDKAMHLSPHRCSGYLHEMCTWPNQIIWKHSLGFVTQEAPTPTQKLLTVNGCWGWADQVPAENWKVALAPHMALHPQAALTGPSEWWKVFFKKDRMLWGLCKMKGLGEAVEWIWSKYRYKYKDERW